MLLKSKIENENRKKYLRKCFQCLPIKDDDDDDNLGVKILLLAKIPFDFYGFRINCSIIVNILSIIHRMGKPVIIEQINTI